jgi:exonuclease III
MSMLRFWLCAAVASWFCAPAHAQQQVRIASYNIKFFDTQVSPARLDNLRNVISELDADIIGLQEIDDRAALAALFNPNEWDIVIDDDSGNNQDVAVVVRRPLRALDLPADLDADDKDFLFSGTANNNPFPNRRDLLCVKISIPGETEPLFVMVHHAKARVGGRTTTDPRREDASRAIVSLLEQEFDGKRYVIVGDCNDNPDDKSMNILETGSGSAAGGPEEIEGPFLINVCDALAAQDRVSWGLKGNDVVNGVLNTIEPGSRLKNNNERGTSGSVSPILFDQILFPVSMKPLYVSGSAKVFEGPSAVIGGSNAASDHVPVFADFVFGGAQPTDPDDPVVASTGLTIVELLPNPQGEDRGNEEVILANAGTATANLQGWRLRDRAGNTFLLSGTIAAGVRATILLPAGSLPLNNDGDDVDLIDPQGTSVNHRSYGPVASGQRVTFP